MNSAPSQQEKRTIKVKDFLFDFHAGMEDSRLLIKYHLTPVGLEKFYSMLVERGILDADQVAGRSSAPAMVQDVSAQPDPETSSYICPTCLTAHDAMFDICPCCGVSFQELLQAPAPVKAAELVPKDEDAFVPAPPVQEEQNSDFFATAEIPQPKQKMGPISFSAWKDSVANSRTGDSDRFSFRPDRNSFEDSMDEIVTGMPLEEYDHETFSPRTEGEGHVMCEHCDTVTKPALRDLYDRTRSIHVLGMSGIALVLGFFAAVALSFFDSYSFGRLLVVYLAALFVLCGGVFLAVGSFLYFAREKVFYCAQCQRLYPRA
jgi:hypothetical protein